MDIPEMREMLGIGFLMISKEMFFQYCNKKMNFGDVIEFFFKLVEFRGL